MAVAVLSSKFKNVFRKRVKTAIEVDNSYCGNSNCHGNIPLMP